jgi:hypothetical protein
MEIKIKMEVMLIVVVQYVTKHVSLIKVAKKTAIVSMVIVLQQQKYVNVSIHFLFIFILHLSFHIFQNFVSESSNQSVFFELVFVRKVKKIHIFSFAVKKVSTDHRTYEKRFIDLETRVYKPFS